MNERLEKMRELGQAPWVDELSREDIQNGGLERMIEDGIVGVTSNPAIFQKAIAGSDLYDEQLAGAGRKRGRPQRDVLGGRQEGYPGRLRHLHARPRGDRGEGRLYLPGGPARHSLRHGGHGRRGHPAARDGRQAQPLRQDTGHLARARCHRGDDLPRQVHKRNPDLLPRTLPRSGPRLHKRPPEAGRKRRRPLRRTLRGKLLRLQDRLRSGQAIRRTRRRRPREANSP